MINLFEKEGESGFDDMNETDIFVDGEGLRPRRRRVSRLVEEPEEYEERARYEEPVRSVEPARSEEPVRSVEPVRSDGALPNPLKQPVRERESRRPRRDMNLFEDLNMPDEIPEDLGGGKKEEVVLDAMKRYKEVQRRLKESKTSKEFYEVGRSQGQVEGMIEGFILACMNNGVDLEVISKKLVLTFNLNKKDAEDYLRSFYETRNIEFEEVGYE